MHKLPAIRPAVILVALFLAAPAPGGGATRATQAQAQAVKIFFILDEGNGRFGKRVGCGDSVVPVVVKVAATSSPLKAAFTELLAAEGEFYCQTGLRNSLSQSSLRVESVAVKGGVATVRLAGEYRDGGHCDTPRAQAQLIETARQFPTVRRVRILVNGAELKFNPTD
jgi:spore germination protein GerM